MSEPETCSRHPTRLFFDTKKLRLTGDGTDVPISSFEAVTGPVTFTIIAPFTVATEDIARKILTADSFSALIHPDDWVGLVAYDSKARVFLDYGNDPQAMSRAVQIGFIGSREQESDLAGAIRWLAPRADAIEGRKVSIIISDGCEQALGANAEELRKLLVARPETTAFTIIANWKSTKECWKGAAMLISLAGLSGGRGYVSANDSEGVFVLGDIKSTLEHQYRVKFPSAPSYSHYEINYPDPEAVIGFKDRQSIKDKLAAMQVQEKDLQRSMALTGAEADAIAQKTVEDRKGPSKLSSFLSGLAEVMATLPSGESAHPTLGAIPDVPAQSAGAVSTPPGAAANASSGHASSSSVALMSQCTRTTYDAGNLWIVNSCSTALTVKFTSDSGNTWGQTDVGGNNRVMVSASGVGYNPQQDGHVYLFACPQGFQPVMDNGSAWLANNYKGRFHCSK